MTEFKELKLTELVASSTNPRTEFEENSLKELAESIKQHGVLQPIIARIHPDNNKKYEVVCGERRFRASKISGVKTIPVSIREFNDDEVFEIQIIENLERKDVHPMDEAVAFKRMVESGKYTIEDIAAKVAKNLTFVAQRLKLNDLIMDLQNDFKAGKFGIGHAVLLARVDEESQQEILSDYTNDFYPTISDLKYELQDNFLDNAKFDLQDETLVPEAGPCSTCPKSSFGNPVLFPDLEDNRCFDKKCFENKTEIFQSNKLQKIIDENPGIQLVCNYGEPEEHLGNVAASNGKTVLKWNHYNGSIEDNKHSIQAFNIYSWQIIWITLTGRSVEKGVTSSPEENIKTEIFNIKSRADRALELDREKIYIRALKEITKNEERNNKMLNSDTLELCEKKALALSIISYQDDKWIEEEYGQKLGYNDRHNQLDKIFSDSFLNKLIRHHIQRSLISENIADFQKHDRAAYMHSIFGHYFPNEIELYTLEQTAIAEKRIIKSDQRIKVLQDEIDGKIDTVKRCASCKKSDDDFLEEFSVPAMWKGDLCHSCYVKSDNTDTEQICRVCGCTNDNCIQCIEKTGHACHWVEDDLCSACVEILDVESEPSTDVSNLPTFEKITRKKKFSLNNSYFKNHLNTEPGTPFEIYSYFKQHGELPFDMDPEENPNWMYETYIEFQKRAGVYNSQFFTPPATAERIAELADEYFTTVGIEPYVLDACCGFGMLTKPLTEKGFLVKGIDNNSEILKMYSEFTGCLSEQKDINSYMNQDPKWMNIVANPPYEIKELTQFFKLLYDLLENGGLAILLLPKGFVDKERPKQLVETLELFTVIHREDMQEDFERTAINAEIVVIER
ncbi:ParB/RepB/Spo0J family partition protein [Chryseobacterium sp. SNU WT5]|uniref:ParB/RepB/Spo0J family partition protein n=1 Tax=Chryseobacterium sp. SNU WT5 TaxID=2594269 RepID=UPI00117DCF08|nr:ParB/RepB/Spo0J family partition protein [Chryseobacterium sp. SNU WT5]QDP86048.1 ParB/RepB/Spo0J family partition protein [Chryseobacterium sp. SNU WT5]